MTAPSDRCGTTAGYQAHRRAKQEACVPCRAAAAADRRRRVAYEYLTGGQKMMVDATGTRRRVQALARIGWPLSELADRLGVRFQNVHDYTTRERTRRTSAAKVAALYDELSMIPGPSSSAAKRAAAKGWAPPLAWDDDTIDDPRARPNWGVAASRLVKPIDDIAVTRAMHGDRVRLTRQERAEAARRLKAHGLSANEISRRLHIEQRSVQRIARNDKEAS